MKYKIKRLLWLTAFIFVFGLWIDSASTFAVFSIDKEYGLKHESNKIVVEDVKNYGIGAIFFADSVLLFSYYVALVMGGLFFVSYIQKTIKIYSERELIAIGLSLSFLSLAFMKIGAAFLNFIVLIKVLFFI
ncbi:MAG: hypothetical protein AABY22_05845 [Nanoarchaeota archaeon]